MLYQLRVYRPSSPPQIIQLQALSDDVARQLAEQQGYKVLSVVVKKQRWQRPTKFPLLLFCQELTVLLNAGLLLTEALQTLIEKEKQSDVKTVIQNILQKVRQGQSFSESLQAQPDQFPNLFIAMVRACETTGNLAEGLNRFALYLQQIDVLRKRIQSAAIYPAIILGFGVLVLLFLLAYVVPRFSQIYQSRDTDLSFASQLMLSMGELVNQYGGVMMLVFLGVLITSYYSFSKASVRTKITNTISRLPVVGERFRIYHLSRFYRTFATLLRSGIPVVSALSMVNELLGPGLQTQVEAARRRIIDGETFTQAMQSSDLVTPVASQLFRVGERAGNLDQMMQRTAEFHEGEMMRWVDVFSKLVEPILMALLGLVIGLIVFLMYMPIFELASGI